MESVRSSTSVLAAIASVLRRAATESAARHSTEAHYHLRPHCHQRPLAGALANRTSFVLSSLVGDARTVQ